MLCPRRNELGDTSNFNVPKDDFWHPERNTCSWCGSVSPERFMQAARDGEEIVPTDKSYKAYVGSAHQKFYYQHLNDAQRLEFVDLLNAKKLNIGYPGNFYVPPFFLSFVASSL